MTATQLPPATRTSLLPVSEPILSNWTVVLDQCGEEIYVEHVTGAGPQDALTAAIERKVDDYLVEYPDSDKDELRVLISEFHCLAVFSGHHQNLVAGINLPAVGGAVLAAATRRRTAA